MPHSARNKDKRIVSAIPIDKRNGYLVKNLMGGLRQIYGSVRPIGVLKRGRTRLQFGPIVLCG
jgi:hypothetical protein